MVTQYHEPYIYGHVCVCLRWRIYIPMYFEDSKFQWPTRLIWIGHPRFTTLGCFILALTAVPTKKHPTEVFGWLANKTVCACVCSIILLKGTKHHLQWCGLAEFPKYFQGRGFHVFLPTGPTKFHQHPHLLGFLREIFGGSQLHPGSLIARPWKWWEWTSILGTFWVYRLLD